MAIILVVLASLMNATFTLPMKAMRRWTWQTSWSVWTVFALIGLPLLTAELTVPHLWRLYGAAGIRTLIPVVLFGLCWGVAQVLFGIAIEKVGVATTFSLVLGTSACLGSLLPLFLSSGTSRGSNLYLLSGVGIIAVGLVFCTLAGRGREHELLADAGLTGARSAKGAGIALLSGVCASAMNLGLANGDILIQSASRSGAISLFAANIVWLPLLVGGAIPNLAYCLYLTRRQRTGREFTAKNSAGHFALALLMATLWFGSSTCYGSAVQMWGAAGAENEWPIFMSLIVVFSSMLSFITGEWLGVSRKFRLAQVAGMVVLVFGVFTISNGGR